MKRIFLTIAMILSLGLSMQGVAAQVDDTQLAAEDVKGLESGYARSYGVDFEALMSTPTAELDVSAMMRSVSLYGYSFDSDDNAKAFISLSEEEFKKSFAEAAEDADVTVSDLKDSDLDRDGIHITIDMAEEGVGMSMVIFADGSDVFMIMGMDVDVESATSLSIEYAKFVIDAEVKTDEVTFNEDGTSTGGVFDRMPQTGDEILGDFIISGDLDILAD